MGVIHNGITLNANAINVLNNLSKKSKKLFFLSNAPSSSEKVRMFLKKMNLDDKFLKI